LQAWPRACRAVRQVCNQSGYELPDIIAPHAAPAKSLVRIASGSAFPQRSLEMRAIFTMSRAQPPGVRSWAFWKANQFQILSPSGNKQGQDKLELLVANADSCHCRVHNSRLSIFQVAAGRWSRGRCHTRSMQCSLNGPFPVIHETWPGFNACSTDFLAQSGMLCSAAPASCSRTTRALECKPPFSPGNCTTRLERIPLG
jgi:hypothetical protein